jgi:hypothetical protein
MKNYQLSFAAAALGLLAAGAYSVQAQIVGPLTDTYTSDGDTLTIVSTVTENASSVYTYDYQISTSPGADLTSFTIGDFPTAIGATAITLVGGANQSGVLSDSVFWDWNPATDGGLTSAEVAYTSTVAPGLSNFSLNDDVIDWSSPPPIPAPVPEPSTVAAGCLLLLPFGIGTLRALRKERLV